MSSLHSDVDTRSPTVFRITMEGTEIQPRRRRDPVSALPACCRPGRVSHSRRQFANRALRSAHKVDPVAHASTLQQVCNRTKGKRATVLEKSPNKWRVRSLSTAKWLALKTREQAGIQTGATEVTTLLMPCVSCHMMLTSCGATLLQSFAILENRSGSSHGSGESCANERKQLV